MCLGYEILVKDSHSVTNNTKRALKVFRVRQGVAKLSDKLDSIVDIGRLVYLGGRSRRAQFRRHAL